MARLAAILNAVGRALRRHQRSLGSFAGNNFFIASALVMQDAGSFVYFTIGLLLLFPLSTDPLRRIPQSRLGLWPLNARELTILRILSPWVNPITWVIVALAIWMAHGRVSVGLWVLCSALVVSGFLLSSLPLSGNHAVWRCVPQFPGALNQLVRKNVRGMLCTLDVYCALVLSAGALAFRLFGPGLPPKALLVLTILVVVALSSYAQCLFGLDGGGGLSRYRLLPLPGWQVLAAKDAAFLLVAVPLTLPLAPLAGLGAALTALAIGHRHSVSAPETQVRWRFSAGAPFLMEGLLQVVAIGAAASLVFFSNVLFLIPCVLAWAGSLWWYGRPKSLIPVQPC